MKVLGIDPGYDRLGVAIVERSNNREVVRFSTCLESSRTLSLAERLYTLGNELNTVLKTHKPDALAIETIFFNKNTKTAIGVAQARGMIVYLAQAHGCRVYEYGPQEVKVAVTGYGKSDKAAVIMMVQRLTDGVPAAAHDDEYDAIAVGITCLAHNATGR